MAIQVNDPIGDNSEIMNCCALILPWFLILHIVQIK